MTTNTTTKTSLTCRAAACLILAYTGIANADEQWKPQTFDLDNGMKFVVLPDHRAPVVTNMVWYKIGAADEKKGKSGLAHLFEHLMFKGTKNIPSGEFSKIVARNGGQDNAFTSQDYTAYYQRIAKNRLKLMMELEAGRMNSLLLSEQDVLPERDVVKEERRQRLDNNPGALLYEKAMAKLYRGHPYAIPVIGIMDEVAALDRNDALDFYKRNYGPQNAIGVIAGDITADELKPLAEQTFGQIQPTGIALNTSLPEVPPLHRNKTVTHRDAKVRQPEITLYWLGTDAKNPDTYALQALMRLMGRGRTSFLFRRLVETEKLAVTVATGTSGPSRADGYLFLYAIPSPNVSLEKLESAIHKALHDFLNSEPDPEQLETVKSNMIAQAIYARDSQIAMANWFGSSLTLGLSIEKILNRQTDIEAISTADVSRVAKQYLQKNKFVTTYLLPEKQ